MDALVREAWLPIFQMYGDGDVPSWDAFCERFGQHFAPRAEMNLHALTGQQLRRTAMKMRSLQRQVATAGA